MKTFKDGYNAYYNNNQRDSRNGLMWLKGWDDAKAGYRLNGSHPDEDFQARYHGPDNLSRSVDLGYAQ